jgi:hypothetical protein
MSSVPGPIRCKKVVKVAFQKSNSANGNNPTSSSSSQLFEEQNLSDQSNSGHNASLLLKASFDKKVRPNIHPSLSTDSLSSICDNIERSSSLDEEQPRNNRKRTHSTTFIRPPKLKQLKNIQQLILQYQTQALASLASPPSTTNHKRSLTPTPALNGLSIANPNQLLSSHSDHHSEAGDNTHSPLLYAIDGIWLRKWMKYVCTPIIITGNNNKTDNQKEERPGPISNWNLVHREEEAQQQTGPETTENSTTMTTTKDHSLDFWNNRSTSHRIAMNSPEYESSCHRLKPNLGVAEPEDFYLIPSEAWTAFFSWYSGGPPLPRLLSRSALDKRDHITPTMDRTDLHFKSFPLSKELMNLLFRFDEISFQEKKWLTNSGSNDTGIVMLSKEALHAYYIVENEEQEQERLKLLQMDLYPKELPTVRSVLERSGLKSSVSYSDFMELEDDSSSYGHYNSTSANNSLPGTPTRTRNNSNAAGSGVGSGTISPKRGLSPKRPMSGRVFEAIPEGNNQEEENTPPTTATSNANVFFGKSSSSSLLHRGGRDSPVSPVPVINLPKINKDNNDDKQDNNNTKSSNDHNDPDPTPEQMSKIKSFSEIASLRPLPPQPLQQPPTVSPTPPSPAVVLDHCVVCGEISKSRCSQCGFMTYCSKDCQKLHWTKYHKNHCKVIKEKYGSLIPVTPNSNNNNNNGANSDSPSSKPMNITLSEKKKVIPLQEQMTIFGRQGKVGLFNLGNSCYMNSSLQCLLHILPLSKYFLSSKHLQDMNVNNRDGTKGDLLKAYAGLVQEIYLDNRNIVSPQQFKRILGQINEEYSGYQQQDAHEVIELLLDKLHEDTNRIHGQKPYTLKLEGDGSNDITIARDTFLRHKTRDSSYIQDLFGFLMRSQLTCPTCSKISVSYEYHNTLQVRKTRSDVIT